MYTTITGSDWDSTLRRSGNGGCDLLVTLRIRLLPRDPTGRPGSVHLADNSSQVRHGHVPEYGGEPKRCRSWLRSDWEQFRDRFAGTVEDPWRDQFCLLVPENCPPELYRELAFSRTIPAFVTCSLQIIVVEHNSSERAHARLAVVHLEDDELSFRQFVTTDRENGVITNRSLEAQRNRSTYRAPRWLRQTAAAHEVGHLLSLDHPGGRGGDLCHYIGHDLYEEATIMGLGNEVTERHGKVWLDRIPRHTRCRQGWRVLSTAALEKYKIRWARVHASRNP